MNGMMSLPFYLARTKRGYTGYVFCLVLILALTAFDRCNTASRCPCNGIEAFVTRLPIASSNRKIGFQYYATTPTFAAKRRQNSEYSVVNDSDDKEEDDGNQATSNQNAFIDDGNDEVDDFEVITLLENDDDAVNEGFEDEYVQDLDLAQVSDEAFGSDANSFRGDKCLGALFKSTVSSAGAGAAVVTIQVGDVNLARKAWKKRRRSGSPLLVPCSILSVDPETMIRSNVMYLLYKYGVETKAITHQRPGLELTMSEVANYHRKQFKISLSKLANALGFDSPQQMVEHVLDETFQQRQGIYLLPSPSGEPNNMRVSTPLLSRHRAHQRISEHAVVLEFILGQEGDDVYIDDEDEDLSISSGGTGAPIVKHTGRIQGTRPRLVPTADVSSDSSGPTSPSKKKHRTMSPLSAALRVSSQASLANIPSGSIHSAVVFGFDTHGDGGLPLLTLSLVSLDSANNTTFSTGLHRSEKQQQQQQRYQGSWMDLRPCQYALHELQVGQGPLDATVVHVSKTGTSFVDATVGRRASSSRRGQQKQDEHMIPVVGMLRRQDAVQPTDGAEHRNVMRLDKNAADDAEDDEIDNEMELALGENDEDYDSDDDFDDDVEDVAEEDISYLFNALEDATEFEEVDIERDDDDDEEEEEEEEEVLEEAEMIEEDVTHLFELSEDGTLVYQNPETGKKEVFHLDDDAIPEPTDAHSSLPREGKLSTSRSKTRIPSKNAKKVNDSAGFGKPSVNSRSKEDPDPAYKKRQLKVGDKVQVYVKSISKQSGRFMVTMDPNVRKPKEVKRDHAVEKKLARLAQQLGGSLDRVNRLRGRECSGIVKATSQTSGWLYVQPQLENLPVGVATLSAVLKSGENDTESRIQTGDAVRIRLDGIDEERGQLSMTVLEKLKP